jgi:hypothetical protein
MTFSSTTGSGAEAAQGMERAFREALRAPGAVVREELYAFAGRPVRLCAVGAQLAERTHRAFAHLKRGAEAGSSALLIDLWDERDTGVPGPLDAAAAGANRSWIACGGTLVASDDGRYVTFRYGDSITMLDRQAQRMIGCRRDGSQIAGGEYSKPLLLMLSIWHHDRGVQLLHAGAIACDGAGVLLPGESGTGKSTTCLASVVQGLQFLGDDFVGLERASDGTFLVHSVFSTACVARKNLSRFDDIRQHAVDDDSADDEKPIFFLSELFPDRLCATAPVRAVVLLSVDHERTEIRPARPAEALRQFAASTLHTVVPRPGREALKAIGALVERVPAYWLVLGPDLRDIRPSISRIVSMAVGRDGL